MMRETDLNQLKLCLDYLLANKNPANINLPDCFIPLAEKLALLYRHQNEALEYTNQLSAGNMELTAPLSPDNCMAYSLNNLGTQLQHLTRQATAAANGDYSQSADFIGDLSRAFNYLAEKLQDNELRLKEQEDVLIGMFEKLDSTIVVDYKNEKILYANKSAVSGFGVQVNTACAQYEGIIKEALQIGALRNKFELYDADNEKWYGISTHNLQWRNKAMARLYYCLDITQHKQRINSLEIQTRTDALTGIGNRRGMNYAYDCAWKISLRAEKPLSAIMLDIDNFRDVNNTYGHLQGDKCLVKLAEILKEIITRSTDVLARYGGEEFIAFLPFTDFDNSMRLAEKIRSQTEQTDIMLTDASGREVPVRITISVGVASLIPKLGDNPQDLIAAADAASYVSKNSGRNQVHGFMVEQNTAAQG